MIPGALSAKNLCFVTCESHRKWGRLIKKVRLFYQLTTTLFKSRQLPPMTVQCVLSQGNKERWATLLLEWALEWYWALLRKQHRLFFSVISRRRLEHKVKGIRGHCVDQESSPLPHWLCSDQRCFTNQSKCADGGKGPDWTDGHCLFGLHYFLTKPSHFWDPVLLHVGMYPVSLLEHKQG